MTTATREAAPALGTRRVLGSPVSAVRQIRTTPGRLSLIAVGLVILTVLTGIVGAIALQQRQSTISSLIDHQEPLAAAAQQLYRSLSDADATAASAFLSGGIEPSDLRTRYENDIAQTGAALAKASSDVGDDQQAQAQVQQLNQQLPVYTSLVETARTYNRQTLPIGAAYLREASGLMRTTLLPAAKSLYTIDFARLSAEQSAARSFPWLIVILTVLLLAALIATQRYLTRKTNRLINIGLFTATAAVVLALIWGTVALLVESSGVADGQRNGSALVDVLVKARIATLNMRADETLSLVAHGDNAAQYDDEFKTLTKQVSGDGADNQLLRAKDLAPNDQVSGAVRAALDNTDAYLKADGRIRDQYGTGQYKEAVQTAIGSQPNSAAATFAKLDDNLIAALNGGRQEFLNQTVDARAALTGLAPGVAVLALLAAIALTVGITQRVREYR